MQAKAPLSGELFPDLIGFRDDRYIGQPIQTFKPQNFQTFKPRIAVMMRHFAHTAVGPESHGRGGVANIYDEKSHSSLMKMLRHSVGSPWHWSSICSFGKIGLERSQ